MIHTHYEPDSVETSNLTQIVLPLFVLQILQIHAMDDHIELSRVVSVLFHHTVKDHLDVFTFVMDGEVTLVVIESFLDMSGDIGGDLTYHLLKVNSRMIAIDNHIRATARYLLANE